MKQIFTTVFILFTHIGFSQTMSPAFEPSNVKTLKPKIGIKAGYNFAKVEGNTIRFSPNNTGGFMFAAFYTPSVRNGLGYRTEVIFSRQGFSFDEGGNRQAVTQDYIYMPHLTTFTIAKRVQLQAGGQVGYLLNAKKTSASTSNESAAMDYMNRIDYGFAAGVEIYPFKGLLVGGRYNLGMGNIYKNGSSASATSSPFPFNTSDIKGKNVVVQFFIGYQF